jgi:haloalkane dehalogenase
MTETALARFRSIEVQEAVLEGYRIAFRRVGSGPPVLFIHGWPLSGVTYRHAVDALKDEHTCIVPDLPGAGDSPWDPRVTEMFGDFTRLMRLLVDHLGLTRFAIVAHDSGGTIARKLAAELGPRVTGLLLSNTELAGHHPKLVALFQRSAALPGAEIMFRWLLGRSAYLRSELGFGGCFGDRSLIEGEFHDACIRPLLEGGMSGPLAALRSANLGVVDELAAIHARIVAPTTFVWGDADRFFPIDRARSMAAQFSSLRVFHNVPGAKLYVQEEAPEKIAELTRALLRDDQQPALVRAPQELHARPPHAHSSEASS